jgi:hypothetical protein
VGVAWNDVPTVEDKDTYVRVYASSDRGGFYSDKFEHVTARLEVDGNGLMPVNVIPGGPFIDLGPRSSIDRQQANHTFNFRIPGNWCRGSATIDAKIIGINEIGGYQAVYQRRFWKWHPKKPYRVRYIRLGDGRPNGTGYTTSDADALRITFRMFDLLPSPPTDIGPAWLRTWWDSSAWPEDRSGLMHHLDDQHNCSLWESLWPWSDPCPSPDGAKWLGFYPDPVGDGWGITSSSSRNTAVVGLDKRAAAHEIGHTLCLQHVNMGCGSVWPDPSYRCDSDFGRKAFDVLPNAGLLDDVPFDPETLAPMQGTVYDVMTYACQKWVSRLTWLREKDLDT